MILGSPTVVSVRMANGLDLTTITSVLSVTTFIIGVLLGVIIKRTLKLALAVVALGVLLATTGFLNFALSEPTATTIYRVFREAPQVATQAAELARLLPISSAAFLIGAAIGFWKG